MVAPASSKITRPRFDGNSVAIAGRSIPGCAFRISMAAPQTAPEIARGNNGVRLPISNQPHPHHDGRISFLPDGNPRRLTHPDGLGCVLGEKIGRQMAMGIQQWPHSVVIPDQDDSNVRHRLGGGNGTCHNGGRCFIASHRIDDYGNGFGLGSSGVWH
jgi:hypothetical protein